MRSDVIAPDITSKKQALIARIADQRLLLSGLIAEAQPLIAIADKGLSVIKVVRANAAWIGVGLGLLAPVLLANRRPAARAVLTLTGASALVWIRRGVMAYQAWKQLRKLISERTQPEGRRRLPNEIAEASEPAALR
jgi:hypothetical protein